MMSPSDKTDAFLGGRLAVRQGAYRAGADPVFLAAAVPARSGQSVLELGVGSGVALFCLASRVPGLRLVGLERAPEAAALARINADANQIDADIIEGDVAAMPEVLRARSFDHVMMNPPFFDVGTPSDDPGRRVARHEETALADWLDAGVRRLKPGGALTLIHATERVPDILSGLSGRLGGLTLRPLAPRAGRAAKRVILRGTKGARAPFRMLAPFILHDGDSHLRDGDSYTPTATRILRNGEAFPD
ncbi:MAG: methyltransferase [Pseudomonadota bacterium]